MFLESISLQNFKNYLDLKTSFSDGINTIVGQNGSGKTNLLDAIYYLCFTKSAINNIDSQNVNHEQDYFLIHGEFRVEPKKVKVNCAFKKGDKKSFLLNSKPIEKASEYIGTFPLVMIAPGDTEIIQEGSEMRRKFVDGMISQVSSDYLEELFKYHRQLKQRNSFLKQHEYRQTPDPIVLDAYDNYLIKSGKTIADYRQKVLEDFLPIFQNHYKNLSDNKEQVDIQYQSDFLGEDFEVKFRSYRDKDIEKQRTVCGIHRDEFLFLIDGYPLKKFGSQGQQKSFLIALKLALYDVLKEKKGLKPIILLDDIFDKLDDLRIQKLVSMIADHHFGQIFITDARPERTEHFMSGIEDQIKILEVSDGQLL